MCSNPWFWAFRRGPKPVVYVFISVVFHRLNETSPLQESREQQIRDFTLEGVDKDNTEISEAMETLKQEQTKILTIFRKDI